MNVELILWVLIAFAVVWAAGALLTLALDWLSQPRPDPLDVEAGEP